MTVYCVTNYNANSYYNNMTFKSVNLLYTLFIIKGELNIFYLILILN